MIGQAGTESRLHVPAGFDLLCFTVSGSSPPLPPLSPPSTWQRCWQPPTLGALFLSFSDCHFCLCGELRFRFRCTTAHMGLICLARKGSGAKGGGKKQKRKRREWKKVSDKLGSFLQSAGYLFLLVQRRLSLKCVPEKSKKERKPRPGWCLVCFSFSISYRVSVVCFFFLPASARSFLFWSLHPRQFVRICACVRPRVRFCACV